MAEAAHEWLGNRVRQALVIAPASGFPGDGHDWSCERLVGDHPVPSTRSHRAAERALALADGIPRDGLLLVLLSGGASSLMAAPAHGLTLDDKRRTTDLLLRAGADIQALNTVRKHISAIKGGQLAARTQAPVLTLAISDVVGDDASIIGSGPTVADATTFADALGVLDRFGGRARFPAPVVQRLSDGAGGTLEETPKPGDRRLTSTIWRLVGSRFDAMEGAAREARARGYVVKVLDEPIVGEARAAGRAYVDRLRSGEGHDRPLCLVSSGETTVRVGGSGRGGRNQEVAASVAEHLPALDRLVVFASCGTDGVDGPTDAAGATVDSTTVARAAAVGLTASAFLDANDTYHFFRPLDDLILTGPTGTNVGDLQVCLVGPG